MKTHCNKGHEFTTENTYVTPKTGWRGCRTCTRNRGRSYRKANSSHCRNRQLLSKYGITIEVYNQILSTQKGRCAICKRLPGKRKKLGVDHKHTKEVSKSIKQNIRGLLCTRCNSALGLFNDDRATLQIAANYLAASPLFDDIISY